MLLDGLTVLNIDVEYEVTIDESVSMVKFNKRKENNND